MKKKDIEKMLINSADNFVPECLDKILEKTKFITPEKPTTQPRQSFACFRRFATAFSAVLIFFSLGVVSFFGYMNSDYMTVYLDINPSIAITVNRFEKVKSIEFINQDAKVLFENYRAKGKPLEQVINEFLEKYLQKTERLEEDAVLYLSAYCKNNSKSEEILKRLKTKASQVLKDKNADIPIEELKITKQERNQAKDKQISPVKLKLIEQILKVSDEHAEEQLQNMSIGELKKLLNDLIPDNNRTEGNNQQGSDPNGDNQSQNGGPNLFGNGGKDQGKSR